MTTEFNVLALVKGDERYVYVYDDLGNYECQYSSPWYEVRSCMDFAFTPYAGSVVNYIHMGGVTSHIEWLEGYQPNYVTFSISLNIGSLVY